MAIRALFMIIILLEACHLLSMVGIHLLDKINFFGSHSFLTFWTLLDSMIIFGSVYFFLRKRGTKSSSLTGSS